MSGRPSAGGTSILSRNPRPFVDAREAWAHLSRARRAFSRALTLRFFIFTFERARGAKNARESPRSNFVSLFLSFFPSANARVSLSFRARRRRFTQTTRHRVWVQHRRERRRLEQFHPQVLHGRFSWSENHPSGGSRHVGVLHRFRDHPPRDVENL